MPENTQKKEVFTVGDPVKFKRQDLSAYQVDGLIKILTQNTLTEPLVVTAVRNYENSDCRGHHQEVTVETIGDNKQTITIPAFWFEKAEYGWLKERYGQG